MKVIYEDNHLLVLDKPFGILTQPSGTGQTSLEGLAKQWLKDKYQKKGNVFLHAVHRLDKPVGGIVVFAKTSKSLSRLNEAMRNKDSVKIYWARIENPLPHSEGILEDYLIHGDFKAQVVDASHPDAKLARLKYRMLGINRVEIELETGRYHQIRAQLSHAGCPIAGDIRYGSSEKLNQESIALLHKRLIIPHPITLKPIQFESRLTLP